MNVRDLLKRQEGKRLFAYKCPTGFWTIGFGHNIEAKGLVISEEFAEDLLAQDINDAAAAGGRLLENFIDLDPVRRAAVVSMIFQMGEWNFRRFVKTRKYIEEGDFGMAAAEMLDSDWARIQTPERAKEISRMMLTGNWPDD